MDVQVKWCVGSFQRSIDIFGSRYTTCYTWKEEAIYNPCKVCNNNGMYLYKDHEIIYEHLVWSGFMDNYFLWSKHDETQPRTESIIDEREEANMNVDHVYRHHDDGGD
jgi:alpha-glucuronidase